MKTKMKRLTSFVAVLVMTVAFLANDFSASRVWAMTEGSDLSAEVSLNVISKHLYLGEEGKDTFDFNVSKNAALEGAAYHWYIRTNKGNPDSVTINSRTGVVTAKEAGTAYIRCKITLSDKTVLKPEAKVVVINSITEVAINNIPENQTIEAGKSTDFNRTVLNTRAGQSAAANGITRWEIADDTSGVGSASDNGIVIPSKAGEFSIRAVCFADQADYRLWSMNKEAYAGKITAASDWVKITVFTHEGTAATLDELAELLTAEDITTITIATQEKLDIILYDGSYPDKTLIVDAPNVNIENHAYFKNIILKPANYALWLECVSGNKLTIMESNVLMYAMDTAEIEEVQVGTAEDQNASEDSSKRASNKNEAAIKSFTVWGARSTVEIRQQQLAQGTTTSASSLQPGTVGVISSTGRAVVLGNPTPTSTNAGSAPPILNGPPVGPAPVIGGTSGGFVGGGSGGFGGSTSGGTSGGIPGGSSEGGSGGTGGGTSGGSGSTVTTGPVTIPGSGGIQSGGSGGPVLTMGGPGPALLSGASSSMITNGIGGGLLIQSGGGSTVGAGGAIIGGSGGGLTGGSGGTIIGGSGGGLIGGNGGTINGGSGGLIGGTGGATISGSGGGFSGYIQGSAIRSDWGSGLSIGGPVGTTGTGGTCAFYSDQPETPIVINSNSTVTFSGRGSFAVNLTNGAAGSTISSSTPLKVVSSVVANFNLGPGSEGSILAFSPAGAGSQVYNNSGQDIILAFIGSNGSSGSSVVIVHSGQTAAITAAGASVSGTVRTNPVINKPIAASAIYEGQSLSVSALSGNFKNSTTNQSVAGTLTWDNPTVIVTAAGAYAWTFTPMDTASYNVVKGTVNVNVTSKITPTPASSITATPVYEGQSLQASVLSGYFRYAAFSIIVEGTLTWDNPSAIITASGNYSWTFTPTDTVHYKTVKGTAAVQVIIVIATPAIDSAVTATAVNEGQPLSASVLSGSFKNVSTNLTVEGTLTWDNPAAVVSVSGNYNWTFTPTDVVHYKVVKGTAAVQANIVKVTPVTGSAITATVVNEGQALSASALSGSFKNTATNQAVEGTLLWDNPTATVYSTGDYGWTFTPSDTVHYNVVKGTANVQVNIIQVTPVTGSAITATAINAGQALSASALSGSFKNNTTNETVAGTLAWSNPTAIVNSTGEYGWTFTPTDTAHYNVVEGTATVQVNIVPVTPALGSDIFASVILAGQPLSSTSLTAIFRDSGTGTIVEGTLTWYHSGIIAVTPDQFTWIFNPTNTINYTAAVGLVNVTVIDPTTPEDWLTVMSNAVMMIKSANYNLDVSDASIAAEGNTQEKQTAVEGVINELQPGVEIVSVVWNNYTSKYDVTILKEDHLTVTCITANFY